MSMKYLGKTALEAELFSMFSMSESSPSVYWHHQQAPQVVLVQAGFFMFFRNHSARTSGHDHHRTMGVTQDTS